MSWWSTAAVVYLRVSKGLPFILVSLFGGRGVNLEVAFTHIKGCITGPFFFSARRRCMRVAVARALRRCALACGFAGSALDCGPCGAAGLQGVYRGGEGSLSGAGQMR